MNSRECVNPCEDAEFSEDAVGFLAEMLRIFSRSRHESKLVDFLVQQMAGRGLTGHRDEVGNAIGTREYPDDSGKCPCEIVLLGHVDTVPGEIPVRIRDGAIYGRGAVDAKGSLATFVLAASLARITPGTRLVVIGAVEEETSTSRGARHVVDKYAPRACIIGEPSGACAVTIAYKGRLLLKYTCERPEGHSAGRQCSAAESACRWWQEVSDYARLFNQGKTTLFDQLLPSLLEICSSSDGLQERSMARASLRLPMDFNSDDLVRHLQSRLGSGETITSSGVERAFSSTRTSSLARTFSRVFQNRGLSCEFKRKTGTSDMNVVGPRWKCPIVAYGPGDSQLDHTPNEHLMVDEYLLAIDVLRQVLELLPGQLAR